ncbi:hypothetical protein TRICI_005043 [Trichomonascus ciferrii]|uniref:S-adenosyl-L-methionine-dependent tRNA 4-demethylwyosine synthase n=1 Tax=Trichomonascus ciferrii TaxID=44093 RepID=A0A642UWK6_9ASCO|nr:hypothetical protein TRICI_005043 [Trichomonascus ciferrii]
MELIELWHEYRSLILTLVVVLCVAYYKAVQNVRDMERRQEAVLREKDWYNRRAQETQAKREEQEKKKKEAVPLAVDFTTSNKKTRSGPKKFSGQRPKKGMNGRELPSAASRMIIFYSTLTGTSQRYAERVHKRMCEVMEKEPELQNLDYLEDMDPYFVAPKKELDNTIYLLVVPSYETESPLDYFIEMLKDTYNDFRIDSRPLARLAGFSVFGLGDSEGWPDEDKYCYQAKRVDKLMGKLGAKRIFPLGTGCVKTTIDSSVDSYLEHLENTLKDPSPPEEVDIVDSDDEEEAENDDVIDVEDMGKVIKQTKTKVDDTAKAMVAKDSPTFNSLTKQGYTIVGSHSGVKICRWTKSALRGRGSCYKFSFYGIKSHLCMETTPSLSCSSKCVFCWRHGTNPVGTTWRWQVDAPEDIIKGAMEGHYKKIKQMKGVPGVVAERFTEAFKIRHCALSLVGEPIFYPHINRFVALLHEQRISSFLVCNAQHPAELEALDRVTQLYVSIDASDKDSLKKVDRPLHRDFWERLGQCLDILRAKSYQRTVFRLTLVKDFNTDGIDGYADMVERAQPCFIEVKGVTYCGTSKSNPLTMQNVPFYEEVKKFVESLNQTLNSRGMEYGIAAEHAHSCCILIAQKRFNVDGVWHTAINYDRFFDLLESGADFGPMDYIAPTADWAHYGNGGFNPEDTPHRKGKPINKPTS